MGTPLHLASKLGDWEAVQELVTAGAIVNTQVHPTGATPLLLAAGAGSFVTVWLLIRAGANVDLPDTISSFCTGLVLEQLTVLRMTQCVVCSAGWSYAHSGCREGRSVVKQRRSPRLRTTP
eukprot:m.155426 g.155426  ORF g.155426 m.155426 type:complete len:121 (+) comp14406_c0_seq2:1017-1379(+)